MDTALGPASSVAMHASSFSEPLLLEDKNKLFLLLLFGYALL